MNKKGVSWVIIAVVIIAVVVVGGVAYWALTSTPSDGNGDGNGGETVYTAENATSLSFKVSATIGGSEEEYVFQAKNLGTSEVMMRVEQVSGGMDFVYIMNQADQTAWAYVGGEWMDVSDQFSTYWDDTWAPALEDYQTQLADWETGDWEYDVGDDSYKVYEIELNPTLDDSLFTHTE
jgi:hypothetical protein